MRNLEERFLTRRQARKRSTSTPSPVGACLLSVAALAMGCDGDEPESETDAGAEADVDGGSNSGNDHDGGEPASEGPVLIAERFSTPDGRVMYMGVFPELPTEDVDVSQMTELGNGDVFGCAGDAFFFDSDELTMNKYAVEDDLSLTPAGSFQLGQEGITGWTGAHVCVSKTKAFIINGPGGRMVEWNPKEMKIVDGFDLERPDVPEDMDVQFFEPYWVGDLVFFPLDVVDWDTLAVGITVLAILDPSDGSLEYIYDDRCQAGLSGHVASDGTFYRYQGYGAYFSEYGDAAADDCVLRINPGEREFDSEYQLDLGPINNMWAVDDHSAVVMKLDPDAELPSQDDADDWWSVPVLPTLVDLQSGDESAYSGLSEEPPMNARKLTLDGETFFQLNSFNDDGRVTKTDLMRLTPDGAEKVFTLQGGDFLTLELL